MRGVGVLLVLGLLGGCQEAPHASPPSPTPDPLAVLSAPGHVSGTVTGPKGYDATSQLPARLLQLSEVPLTRVVVTVAGPGLEAIPGAPTVPVDAQGRFELATPITGGMVVARTASASAPLLAVFRDGETVTLSVASTLVAGKIAMAMVSSSTRVDIRSLDRARIDALTASVQHELAIQALSPDYSLASWPQALDLYTYRSQGTLAKAFNALIPGAVAPPMSR